MTKHVLPVGPNDLEPRAPLARAIPLLNVLNGRLRLVQRGWQVAAADISRVALQRAAATAADLTGRVAWAHADLTATPPPAGAFDLVSVQYFPLARQPHHTALPAPAGTHHTHDTVLRAQQRLR